MAAVAPRTFGIYPIHPPAMYLVKHIFPPDGHSAAFIALTTCLSAMVAWLLMKTPLRVIV